MFDLFIESLNFEMVGLMEPRCSLTLLTTSDYRNAVFGTSDSRQTAFLNKLFESFRLKVLDSKVPIY